MDFRGYQTRFVKVSQTLPDDVLGIIRAYSKPIGLRLDWRTCKRHESGLIYQVNDHLMDMIPLRCISHEEVMDEIQEWTLFGKVWLLYAPEYKIYAQRRVLIPPPDNMDDYEEWYSHRIQWLNG